MLLDASPHAFILSLDRERSGTLMAGMAEMLSSAAVAPYQPGQLHGQAKMFDEVRLALIALHRQSANYRPLSFDLQRTGRFDEIPPRITPERVEAAWQRIDAEAGRRTETGEFVPLDGR